MTETFYCSVLSKDSNDILIYTLDHYSMYINGINKTFAPDTFLIKNENKDLAYKICDGYLFNLYTQRKMKKQRSDAVMQRLEKELGHYQYSTYEKMITNALKQYRGVFYDPITQTKEDEREEEIEKMNEEILDVLCDIKTEVRKQNSMSKLEEALLEGIVEKGKTIATEQLEEELKERLDKFIQTQYGILPKKIEIVNNNSIKTINGIFHKKFVDILKIVSKGIPLMLTGPAGSGKNHTLEQVAEALDLEFYFTNAVTQEYKLTGFIDANGLYHETEFYKAFKNGGLFFLDEMDASCPESLIVLNSAIANGYFDFPNGRVNAHENFKCVAASNTYGTGADMIYVGRNVLDGATLDRFAVMRFEYDDEVERQLAFDEELFDFIKALRKAVEENSLRYIISMRATINATKMLEIGMSKENILKEVIIKSMQQDDINTIIKKINCNNDWTQILRTIYS